MPTPGGRDPKRGGHCSRPRCPACHWSPPPGRTAVRLRILGTRASTRVGGHGVQDGAGHRCPRGACLNNSFTVGDCQWGLLVLWGQMVLHGSIKVRWARRAQRPKTSKAPTFQPATQHVRAIEHRALRSGLLQKPCFRRRVNGSTTRWFGVRARGDTISSALVHAYGVQCTTRDGVGCPRSVHGNPVRTPRLSFHGHRSAS